MLECDNYIDSIKTCFFILIFFSIDTNEFTIALSLINISENESFKKIYDKEVRS